MLVPTASRSTRTTVLDWTALFGYRSALGQNATIAFDSAHAGSALHINGKNLTELRSASQIATTRGAFFDGVLYNRPDLEAAYADSIEAPSDAALVLRAYAHWGPDFLRHIKGIFALLVWDGRSDTLIAARDPLGCFPLFYAEGAAGLMLSTSTYALAGRRGVSGALNQAALVDHLSHRWLDPHETYLVGVKRLPAGHRLDATPTHTSVTRYWNPTPEGKPVDWIREDELDRFGELFEGAVERCYRQGRSGIFLSGGADSISVAALATDSTRRQGEAEPILLSLGVPTDDDEEAVQRKTGKTLGLQHEILPFGEAVAPEGVVPGALQVASNWPAPIMNPWMLAYTRLVERGILHRVNVFLTGRGGNDWLATSPHLSADVMKHLDVANWWRFIRAWRRSSRAPWPQTIGDAIATYGPGPLAGMLFGAASQRLRSRVRVRRIVKGPRWIAPDRRLRRELRDRAAQQLTPLGEGVGHYLRPGLATRDHVRMSLELEETFEFGRRLGVRILNPYWDADLMAMLYRTPPHLLTGNGRTRGLVRESVGKRFPSLEFRPYRPRAGVTSFYRMTLLIEAGPAWDQLGGVQALADLHVVDRARVSKRFEEITAKAQYDKAGFLWDILSLETWARTHA
jgi:asparagine synthetase B (glutamine-hydrolysing)